MEIGKGPAEGLGSQRKGSWENQVRRYDVGAEGNSCFSAYSLELELGEERSAVFSNPLLHVEAVSIAKVELRVEGEGEQEI